MILIYCIIIGICAIGGFWATFKLSQLLSKDDIVKQAHGMPELLLLNCEVYLEPAEKLKKEILERSAPKISGVQRDSISLSSFFDRDLFKENKVAKNNYEIFPDFYEYFENIRISMILKDENGNKSVFLTPSYDKMKLTSNNTKSSRIEVINYDKKTNLIRVKLVNIQLDVQTQDEYICDLKNGSFELHIATGDMLTPSTISLATLKTKKTSYFMLIDIKNNDLGFTGNLKPLV